jgi:hypothetical protein
MNFLFGFGFGTSVITAWVWGGLSVASDGLKAVMPVLVAYQGRRRHWLRVMAGVVILALVLPYGFLSALGFWAESRGLVVDERSNEKASVTQAQADVGSAEKRLAALAPYRSAGLVEADISGLERERLWQLTHGCQGAASAAGRAFCKRVDALRAELALNKEAQTLTVKIETLKSEIKAALAKGAWREADPLGHAIASVFNLDVSRVRVGLSWMAAILVETVSCLGLLVVEEAGFWAALTRTSAGKIAQRPPWRLVGKAVEAEIVQARARA